MQAVKDKNNGISSKPVFITMAVIAFIISILLVHATTLVESKSNELKEITYTYLKWEQDASDLQDASDYLTEQVRCFAETGDKLYLNLYFEEANVTKRRDNAVEEIHKFVGDSPAYFSLVEAMKESVSLMDTEYYSMRLKVEACMYLIETLPKAIQQTQLRPEDAALSSAEKSELARILVFSDNYHNKKATITSKVDSCINALEAEFNNNHTEKENNLQNILSFQRFLIITSIIIVILMLVVILVFIVRPIQKAVTKIQTDKPLDQYSFKEMNYFAKVYNNQKQTISSLFNNMPAMSFAKDAKTGKYIACNQAFALYARKPNPKGVIGLTDAQLFDAETAHHHINDDKLALSMNEPYIYFEDIIDPSGNVRQLQTTKLKYIDSTGRTCVLGMCADMTDFVKIRRENISSTADYKKARTSGIVFSHIAQTLAQNYIDLYYINTENNEFIEYHTDKTNNTLVETRRGNNFFEQCKIDALKHIYPEDVNAFLKAMDKTTLLKALKDNNAFIMTYRLTHYDMKDSQEPIYVLMKISRMVDDENCIIIALTDINEQTKQQQLAERIKEEHIAYSRINALAGNYLCIYVVDPETDNYREFSSTDSYKTYKIQEEGKNFFATSRENGKNIVYKDDQELYFSLFTKTNVMANIKKNGMFAITYRIVIEGKPHYTQLKAVLFNDENGSKLIIGLNDVDSQIKQKQEYNKRLITAEQEAHLDALTGVKNKHAYLEAEATLNDQIKDNTQPNFAIVILDINDLKKINDTHGHTYGDKYIQGACKIICDTFKHSPVYRIGGDEFLVIAQNGDYANIKQLVNDIYNHNLEAKKNNGIVIACGMAKYNNESSVDIVFEKADQEMYRNKDLLKSDITE